MPGLLTNLFDDGGSSETSESTQSYDAGAHGGIDLSPTVSISHHAEASWQDADGTTHTYTSDTDLTLTVDVQATLDATGSLTQASEAEG